MRAAGTVFSGEVEGRPSTEATRRVQLNPRVLPALEEDFMVCRRSSMSTWLNKGRQKAKHPAAPQATGGFRMVALRDRCNPVNDLLAELWRVNVIP